MFSFSCAKGSVLNGWRGGGKGGGQTRPDSLEFPGLHWATHLLNSLSQVPPVREKPKTASRSKGGNLQVSTVRVRSYIFHSERLGKGMGAGKDLGQRMGHEPRR